jgi:hypothetical protein
MHGVCYHKYVSTIPEIIDKAKVIDPEPVVID